jgi:hypothetical protein
MSCLRKLAVAFAAALVLAAIAGGGSASATVLCKAAESPCAVGNLYPLGTEVHALKTEGVLVMKTELQKGECVSFTTAGKTTAAGSATETVEGTHETLVAAPCAGVFFLKTGGYVIHHVSGTSNGKFTWKGFEVLLKSNGFECTYGGTFEAGTLVGGSPAMLSIKASVPKTGGGIFCSPTMTLESGPIEFTSPKPLFVAAS